MRKPVKRKREKRTKRKPKIKGNCLLLSNRITEVAAVFMLVTIFWRQGDSDQVDELISIVEELLERDLDLSNALQPAFNALCKQMQVELTESTVVENPQRGTGH